MNRGKSIGSQSLALTLPGVLLPMVGQSQIGAAVMQAEVCGASKLHPLKGKLDKKYKAKEERPDKTGEERVPLSCCGCKQIVEKCSQFLLLFEGEGDVETWAGGHWGIASRVAASTRSSGKTQTRKRLTEEVHERCQEVLACNNEALQGPRRPRAERYMDWL